MVNAVKLPSTVSSPESRRGEVLASKSQRPAGAATPFASVWDQVSNAQTEVTIQKGDTLVGVVKQQYLARGQRVDDRTAYRDALKVASENGLSNANLILPGDKVKVTLTQAGSSPSTQDVLSQKGRAWGMRPGSGVESMARNSVVPDTTSTTSSQGPHALLDQTLARAMNMGFVEAQDVSAAKEKIIALGQKFDFDPNHFALLTLVESNGLNPKASNGRCHGILQFCEGPNRGAASVGLAGQAQRILGMDVLKQLDLAEKYFQDIGLHLSPGKKGLDDLYLSVLSPAAQQETRRHVPLPIAGKQASLLYVNGSPQMGITRDSIVQGLMGLAQKILPAWKQVNPQTAVNEIIEPTSTKTR